MTIILYHDLNSMKISFQGVSGKFYPGLRLLYNEIQTPTAVAKYVNIKIELQSLSHKTMKK